MGEKVAVLSSSEALEKHWAHKMVVFSRAAVELIPLWALVLPPTEFLGMLWDGDTIRLEN